MGKSSAQNLNQVSDRRPQAVVKVPISLAWISEVGMSTVISRERS